LKVEIGEDFGMFLVESSSEDYPHIIDLTANDGKGYCTCTDWSVVCSTNIKQRKGRQDCKHVRAAKEYATTTIQNRINTNQ
jgi:predicted nucleic acid-binding Zn finger protein